MELRAVEFRTKDNGGWAAGLGRQFVLGAASWSTGKGIEIGLNFALRDHLPQGADFLADDQTS